MKFGAVVVFAFLFTLLLFTYGVDGGKNKDNKDRERRRKERRERKNNKKTMIDSNPSIISDPTFPVPTTSPIINDDAFGDPILEATKRPHRHHHKSRGKDRREKAKKHKKDRDRRREKGTGEAIEPEIVSFDDMLTVREEDPPTDPAPAPVPTSNEDKMTEEVTAENTLDNVTNLMATTETGNSTTIKVHLQTTATQEPTQTSSPTPQVETTTARRRGREREGRKDKKNKDKRRNKDKKRDQMINDENNEVQPTEFEFSPTIQPEAQTTTTTQESSRRGDRRKNKEERKKDKKDKKNHRSPEAPENTEEIPEVVNEVVPTPETQTQPEITEAIKEKSHPRKDKDKRNRQTGRKSNIEEPREVETSPKKRNRDDNGERRERGRHEKVSSKKDKKKDKDRLREPLDVTNSSTLDECKSDRDCSQGSCCEIHEGSKICRDYNHQEGQKCMDHCACHSGLICQAPEPTRRSQRNKKLGPSRCRVPGINGMGGDFVGLVQDALEDVMDSMKSRDRNN